jgi:hypothetical protein
LVVEVVVDALVPIHSLLHQLEEQRPKEVAAAAVAVPEQCIDLMIFTFHLILQSP